MGDIYKQYYALARLAHSRERQFSQNNNSDSSVCSKEENKDLLSESSHDIFEIDTASAIPDKLAIYQDPLATRIVKSHKSVLLPSQKRSYLAKKKLFSASLDAAWPVIKPKSNNNKLPPAIPPRKKYNSEGDIRCNKTTQNIMAETVPGMNGKVYDETDENVALLESGAASIIKDMELHRDELGSTGDSIFSISSLEDDSDKLSFLTKSMDFDDTKHDLARVIEVNESSRENVFIEEQNHQGEEEEDEYYVDNDDETIYETSNEIRDNELDEPHHKPENDSRAKQSKNLSRSADHSLNKHDRQVSFDTEDVVFHAESDEVELHGESLKYMSDSDVNSHSSDRVIMQGGGEKVGASNFDRRNKNRHSGGSSRLPRSVPNSQKSKENNEDFFPRENKASMKRKEWVMKFKRQKESQKQKKEKEADYKTPLQRKDVIIKQIKKELEDTYKALSQKEQEIKTLCENKGGDGWDIVKEKDNELTEMRKELTEIKATNVKLQDDTANKSHDIEELSEELEKVKKEFREREKYHNDMYLKMYEKGQKAAVIEREEEIEELALKKPDSVSTKELLEKLQHTQSELGRWQSLARRESYDGANRPETTSDAMLQFMKDSMFHYLTDRDDCGVHLRAIVRMLGFTDDEKKRMIQLRKKVKKEKGSQFSGLLLDP